MRKVTVSLFILLVLVLLATFILAACETTGPTPEATSASQTKPPAPTKRPVTPSLTPLTPYPVINLTPYPTK